MERETFLFYRSFWEAVKDLKTTDREKILSNICSFMFDGKEKELKGNSKGYWVLIKPQLLANIKKYENGSKGGRPKKETKTKPMVFENDVENGNLNETETKPNQNLKNKDKGIRNKEEGIKKKESKKKVKHAHGTYNNVKLTDDELERLKNDFPFYQELIEKLSEYIEVKAPKYKNHNLVLRGWVLDWYKDHHSDEDVPLVDDVQDEIVIDQHDKEELTDLLEQLKGGNL